MSESTKASLWVPPDVLSELMYYVTKIDTEVGGLGYIEIDKYNNIIVEEIYLLEQTVHGSECTLSPEGIAKFYEKLISEGRDEDIGKINFWWHSHANMSAFFSSTDDTTMREWCGQYQVALVINKKGEMKARLMSRVPALMLMDIDVSIDWLYVAEHEEWSKNIEEQVKEEKVKTKEWPKNAKSGDMVVYQGGKCFIYDSFGRQIDEGECNPWNLNERDNSAKSLHEMTDAEIAAIDNDIDEWISGCVDGGPLIKEEEEKMALHELWQEEEKETAKMEDEEVTL